MRMSLKNKQTDKQRKDMTIRWPIGQLVFPKSVCYGSNFEKVYKTL